MGKNETLPGTDKDLEQGKLSSTSVLEPFFRDSATCVQKKNCMKAS